jgi:uncharacterized protein YbbC (DUF1343 family)/CubicO group peptidase (beta-lactamase class C family)
MQNHVCSARLRDHWISGWLGLLAIPALALAAPPKLPLVDPASVGFRPERLAALETVIQDGIVAGRMPGCVVAFGRHGQLAWLRAYGQRQIEPEPLPMTTDTLFDMASITKPVATATSVMMLMERGQLRLRDPVSDYFADFAVNGKQEITLTQLLTHHAGLIADNSLSDYEQGYTEAWRRIMQLDLQQPPGTRFVYSDVGYIVLGELIKQVSGMDVHQFTQQNLFGPLGMTETGYLPDEALRTRAATTQQRDGHWMQGEVHDPRAFQLGRVAGHAGLFSTAQDLAVYAQMMLQEGIYGGQRILSPASVQLMTRAYDVSGSLRGLGWDKLSGYSSNRGENFSDRAFGHGGFTGTVMWIDPEWDLFFIFLSNRVHPNGQGNINSLAGRLATIVVGAIDPELESRTQSGAQTAEGEERRAQVQTGLDVLQDLEFALLAGQRVGLITNHTGINRDGVSNMQLFCESPQVNLVALFSPEHGIAGKLDVARIDDSNDSTTGLKVYSLYGATRRPTAEQLASIDTLVFDIQDIGTRFYTYVSTMGLALQSAAEHGKRFVVLDRPNPINGLQVDGPVLDEGRESFVGFHSLPVRHGMTVGELARMFVDELALEVDLHVVPVKGWRRDQYFDQTGLRWVDPSPNMRNLHQALLYPGIGLLETTNLSVGRGTDTPFERIGAPWIDGRQLAQQLNSRGLAGVTFTPVAFRPTSSVFANQDCQGVHVLITDRHIFQPLDLGFAIAATLRHLYPDQWNCDAYNRLLADDDVWHAVKRSATAEEIRGIYQRELKEFCQRRQAYLMYGGDRPSASDKAPQASEDDEPLEGAP